jgi:hypothetical protein
MIGGRDAISVEPDNCLAAGVDPVQRFYAVRRFRNRLVQIHVALGTRCHTSRSVPFALRATEDNTRSAPGRESRETHTSGQRQLGRHSKTDAAPIMANFKFIGRGAKSGIKKPAG